MFINFSNHPSDKWSDAQIKAALVYGEITDIQFPDIPADADTVYIENLADEYNTRIMKMNPSAVMCQGEFTFTFAVVARLKQRGVTVLAACTQRNVIETEKDGKKYQTAVYEFRQFREY